MSGWFAMKRGITEHPIFKGHPERLAIWVWLLDNAAWKDTRHDVNGKTVMIARGSVSASERRIADEVGVGRQVVRTFLARLKADHMINTDANPGRNTITLCNWDKYQVPDSRDNPPANPRPTHDQPTKETREQDITLEANASNGADAPSIVEVSVVSSAVWAAGKQYLASRGVSNPGAMIGRWLKDHTPLAILGAIEAAQSTGTQDPIPYITKALSGPDHFVPQFDLSKFEAKQ